jgi:hypothetical protein
VKKISFVLVVLFFIASPISACVEENVPLCTYNEETGGELTCIHDNDEHPSSSQEEEGYMPELYDLAGVPKLVKELWNVHKDDVEFYNVAPYIWIATTPDVFFLIENLTIKACFVLNPETGMLGYLWSRK